MSERSRLPTCVGDMGRLLVVTGSTGRLLMAMAGLGARLEAATSTRTFRGLVGADMFSGLGSKVVEQRARVV